jgi:hypothetical protein
MSPTAIRRSPATTNPVQETGAPSGNSVTKLSARHAAASAERFPASAKNQIPHRPVPARRGFVHPRLSYAFGARNSSGLLPVCFRAGNADTGHSPQGRDWPKGDGPLWEIGAQEQRFASSGCQPIGNAGPCAGWWRCARRQRVRRWMAIRCHRLSDRTVGALCSAKILEGIDR